MNSKYLAVGAILGGILLFLWGFLTHAVLPAPMRTFTNEEAVVQALRANAPSDGVYYSAHGIVAAVSFSPPYGDRGDHLGPYLLRQFLSDTLAAALLAFLVAGLPGTIFGKAYWAAIAGFTAFAIKVVPYWNWYGFSPQFIGMEAFDMIGKFFLGGLLMAFLAKKLAPSLIRQS
jgi:predicted secreted protein